MMSKREERQRQGGDQLVPKGTVRLATPTGGQQAGAEKATAKKRDDEAYQATARSSGKTDEHRSRKESTARSSSKTDEHEGDECDKVNKTSRSGAGARTLDVSEEARKALAHCDARQRQERGEGLPVRR